jgi:hypothetical protein
MNIATVASIVTTIITVIIAALVAVITWRRWITNRARLRHELFDRGAGAGVRSRASPGRSACPRGR